MICEYNCILHFQLKADVKPATGKKIHENKENNNVFCNGKALGSSVEISIVPEFMIS